MTDLEVLVWTSVYGARYAGSDLDDEMHRSADAFECATYAVQELRRRKIEPVFGEGLGESSKIEDFVLKSLTRKP